MLEKRKRELDRKYDEEEYNKEIENRPEEFRCPKCDGINKSSGKECVFVATDSNGMIILMERYTRI